MKKLMIVALAALAAGLVAAEVKVDSSFIPLSNGIPRGWVLNAAFKEPGPAPQKPAGVVKIQKSNQGNVLEFSTGKGMAHMYSATTFVAKAGDVFNASAKVSGKGEVSILYYTYSAKTWIATSNTRFVKLTATPTVQKFTGKIADGAKPEQKVANIRVVIAVNPGTELKLSDLKVSLD